MIKDNIYTVALAILILSMITLWAGIISGKNTYYYDEGIAKREMLSLSTNVKFNTEKKYFLNHSHGSSTILNIGKFECCGPSGMVRDNEISMGYVNTVSATQLGTTTKKDIPEIDIEVLGHELVHLITTQPYVVERCPALKENILQEKIAYNWGFLYSQVRSLDEDNLIRLTK